MINIIIFSKNRACQLELFLRSSKIFFKAFTKYQPSVIYTYSEQSYARGYEKLKFLHPECYYACEKEQQVSFKQQVLNLVNRNNPYTVFFVDDLVFRQSFALEDEEVQLFASNIEILCLSLRLSPRINYCYAFDKYTSPPEFEPNLIWNWQCMPSNTDWGYPMSLDGHLYRTHEIKPLISQIEFNTPNQLESGLAASVANLSHLCKANCYSDSRVINVPANRVQNTHLNRHGNSFSSFDLNQAFLAGNTIDLDSLINVKNFAVHVELPLILNKVDSEVREDVNINIIGETSMTPVVSVVMPVYNGERYLYTSINSILNQTFSDFELIIVDDGSSDRSLEIINSYQDQRIKLIRNEKNFGLAITRNRGIEESSGKYIAILDCDDYAYPTRLVEQLEFMEKNLDYGMVGTWVEVMDENGDLRGEVWKYVEPYNKIPSLLLFRNYFAQSAVFLRKSALPSESYRQQYPPAEDYDLWVRIAKRYKVWNLPKILTRYRQHSSSISNRANDLMERSVCGIISYQISDLGIEVSTEELELHRQIGSLNYQQVDDTLEFLQNSATWFAKLREANSQKRCYQVDDFNQVLADLQLSVSSDLLKAAQLQSQGVQKQLQEARTALEETRVQLQAEGEKIISLWTELEQLQYQLVHSQQESAHLQQELTHFQQELERSQHQIAEMESSKFWRLRQQWLNLKQMIRASTKNS